MSRTVHLHTAPTPRYTWGWNALTAITLATLTACGGGGGSDSTTTPAAIVSIQGTVATGAAVSGTVTLKDARMVERNGVINADGSYTIDATGMQAPFLLRAVGTAGNKQIVLVAPVTASDSNGTVNITPLSDLIVANLGGQAAQAFFSAPDFSKLDKSAVDSALQDLKTKLAPVLEAAGLSNVDFLRQPFKADHSGLDGLLDVLEITVDAATKSATIVSKVTGDSVTDDLQRKGNTDTSVIVVSEDNKKRIEETAKNPSKAQRMGELQAMIDQFNSIFAFGITTAERVQLRALCDATRFVNEDGDCDDFVEDIAANTAIGSKRLSIKRLVAFDASQPGGVDDVLTQAPDGISNDNVGLVIEDSQDLDNAEGAMWVTKNTAGQWRVAGTQRYLGIGLRGAAYRNYTVSDAGVQTLSGSGSGLSIMIDKARSDLTRAVVTGAGLPSDGLTLVPSQTMEDWSIQGEPDGDNLYEGLSALPSTTDVYTIRVYSGTTLVGTFRDRIRSSSVPSSAAENKFAAASTLPTLSGCANGIVSLAWSKPSGSSNDYVSVNCSNGAGTSATQGQSSRSLAQDAVSLTLPMSVANAKQAMAFVTVRDATGVLYTTTMYVALTTSGAGSGGAGGGTSTPDPEPTPPAPQPTPAPVTSSYLQSTATSLQTGTYTAASDESTFTVDTSPAVYQQYCSKAGMQAVAFNSAATVNALSGTSALVGKSFTAAICQAGNPSEDLLVFNGNGTVSDTGSHGDSVVETILRSSSETGQAFSASGSIEPGGQTTFLKAYKVTLGSVEKYFIAEHGQQNGVIDFFGWWQEVTGK